MLGDLIPRLIRKTLGAPRKCPGYLPFIRTVRSRSVAIVMYHGVTATPLSVFNWCQLAADEFEAQMLFLREEYNILPLAEVVVRLQRCLPLPDRAVCVTFDDGFRNVFTTAFPIMKRYDIPSTVFLITGLVGTYQPAWPERLYCAIVNTHKPRVTLFGSVWSLDSQKSRALAVFGVAERLKKMLAHEKDEQLQMLFHDLEVDPRVNSDSVLATMDWDEVAELHNTRLVAFGSHTHTHQILSRLPLDAQYEELCKSRDVLLERLGAAAFFAYPNGTLADFTPETKRLVQDLGYRCGLSTEIGLNGIGSDAYALRRVNIGADTTRSQFELRMLGL
jgi:peptidoglycan/xylan/chitin deacetylase (PgdA/CDA1 family)